MFFKKNNISIFYEKFGNKKEKIIILPGWGNTRKTFNSLISELSKKYTIYIFDYPGFGNSEYPNKDLTIYDYCSIINSFMSENKIVNPIIIGHSFGGRIIILLSAFYKVKFKKIILMSSAGIKHEKNRKQKVKEKIYKLLKLFSIFLIPKIKNIYLNMLIKKFGSTDYKNAHYSLKRTFINIINEDLTNYIKDINDKTLLIWGEKDIDTPIEDAYMMKKSIKESVLKIIKDTSHFFYLEKEKETLNIINIFIKEKD